MEIINVKTGEVKASNKNVQYKSLAIGSCLVVAGFDLKLMVSAMAHIMLPGVSPELSTTPKTRYALNAIEEMLNKMEQFGATKENIEVCIVGGSNVLKRTGDTICRANINSLLKILNDKNIKIKARSIGGTQRRSILFDTKTGKVYHSIGSEEIKLLSCFF